VKKKSSIVIKIFDPWSRKKIIFIQNFIDHTYMFPECEKKSSIVIKIFDPWSWKFQNFIDHSYIFQECEKKKFDRDQEKNNFEIKYHSGKPDQILFFRADIKVWWFHTFWKK